MGFLWWVVEPALYLFAISFVRVAIRGEADPGFVPYLLVALVHWKWFSQSISMGCSSIYRNRTIIKQVPLNKFIYPVFTNVTLIVKYFFTLAVLFVVFIFFDIEPKLTWFALVPLIIIQFCFNLFAGGMLSILVPFIPDLKIVIDNSLLILFFLSGILFEIKNAPEEWQPYLFMNPVVRFIESYRSILLDGEITHSLYLSILFLCSLAGIFLLLWVIKKSNKAFTKVL